MEIGTQVRQEYDRLKGLLRQAPPQPSGRRSIELSDEVTLSGYLYDDPAKDSGIAFDFNPRDGQAGLQVFYEEKSLDQDFPREKTLVRNLLAATDEGGTPDLMTHHSIVQETAVDPSDRTLANRTLDSTAVYPGHGNARSGIIASQKELDKLPLSASQERGLADWNIAH